MAPEPPQTQREAAIARLRDTLADAAGLYAASPDHRSIAVKTALIAARKFIEELALEGVDELRKRQLMTPLSDLTIALGDRDRGIASPLLEPESVSGHHRDSLRREHTKGSAAAVVSILLDCGLGSEEAAKYVAKWLRNAGIKKLDKGRRELDWRTVAGWRYQIMKAVRTAPPDDVSSPEWEQQVDKDFAAGLSMAAVTYRVIMRIGSAEGYPQGLDSPALARACCDRFLAGLRRLEHGS